MKKITSLIMAILITTSFSATGFCIDTYGYALSGVAILEKSQAEFSTVYAEDGRVLTVHNSQISDYVNEGWFTEPVINVCNHDGEWVLIYEKHKDAYLSSGWFLSPDDIPKFTKAVALTFDDGPGAGTSRILDCLEAHGAKATFFVVGTSINRYSDLLKRAYSLGMEIGNHTANHPKLTSLSLSSAKNEISSNADAVEKTTGARPALVRPPYGSYNQSVISNIGQPFILWSIDTLDWKTRNAQKTVDAVLSEVQDGDIILMHDIHLPTAEATEILVPELIKRGFELVTVSELAQKKGVNMQAKAYRNFK